MPNSPAVPEMLRVAIMPSLDKRIEAEPQFPENQADRLTVSENGSGKWWKGVKYSGGKGRSYVCFIVLFGISGVF
jgi:hypothetical protein